MKKLRVERLDLDLRGVSPGVAEAAVRQLGPALQRALAERRLNTHSTTKLDAGRIVLGANSDATVLADGVAERIANRTGRS